MVVGKMTTRRTRCHDRDVVLLGGLEERFPSLVLEDTLARDQQGALRATDQVQRLLDLLCGRTGARFTAVFFLAVIVLELRSIGEARSRDFTREIEMHGAGDARLEIAKSIRAVLPDAVRSDQTLAIFLHAGSEWLLIAG